jgi:acyl-coenzyme A synthetase/AMP-(fatty) acid ligase
MPEEVEDVLREHPLVADVMVAGVPDDRLGEVPNAFVVAGAAPPDGLAAELTNLVRDSLSKYKAPRAVIFVPELPRTANGKLVRAQASALLPH